MPMKNPPHPGRIIRSFCLDALDTTVGKAAIALGISRLTLSKIINEKSGISAEMAVRLSKVFGSTPDTWLRLQLNYDLAAAESRLSSLSLPRLADVSL